MTKHKHASLAASQLRDAAVKVCEEEICSCCWGEEAQAAAEHLLETIAAMPVPEVRWMDLTDDEIDLLCSTYRSSDWYPEDFARAVIAKFKEKQL